MVDTETGEALPGEEHWLYKQRPCEVGRYREGVGGEHSTAKPKRDNITRLGGKAPCIIDASVERGIGECHRLTPPKTRSVGSK